MPRYSKKTKFEEKNEIGLRYQTVLRYAASTGPLCEAIENETIKVYMPKGRDAGFTVLHDREAVSACSMEHARMIVANPAMQLPPADCIQDAPGETALRVRFDYSPVVRAMREMERGAIHFDWINPRYIDRLLDEAFGRWLRFWQSRQPAKITIRTARLEFTPSGIVAHEVYA
jgi:hypothetical protein